MRYHFLTAVILTMLVSCSQNENKRYERQYVAFTQAEIITYKYLERNKELLTLLDSANSNIDSLVSIRQTALKTVQQIKEELVMRSGGRGIKDASYINAMKTDVVEGYFSSKENCDSLTLQLNSIIEFINRSSKTELPCIICPGSESIYFKYDPNYNEATIYELYFKDANLFDAFTNLTLFEHDVLLAEASYIQLWLAKNKIKSM